MTVCPAAADLQRLLDDDLAAAEAGPLRIHLAACSACQRRLDELSEHPGLRPWRGALSVTPPDDPRLGRLLDALCATPVVRDTPPPENTASVVLGLPRADGDLGTLGPYRILAEVGRGGMSVVYKAYDEMLARVVALKMLSPADEPARRRFLREARAAAALSIRSDFVVPLHAVCETAAGAPFLVMEYVEGPTLRQRVTAEGRLDAREAARLVAEAADALAAAHSLGLIHRDVKPANLLYDRAADRARLTDFGLVRAREGAGGTTREGTILGTPEYMSPEQVRTPGQVDVRSDVYGLGVTLYELLTGDVPYRGTPHMVVQRLLHDDPVPPRRLNEAVPRDLETICLKAMAREPDRRYRTAVAFRDDLRRWLNGEPIEARPVGRLGRSWLWCRRRPVVAGLSAALLVVFAAGLGGVLWQWAQARANLREVVAQRERAEANLGDALDAVEQLHTRVSEERLLNEPGMQPLRKELLETARTFYVRLIDRRRDVPAARADLARALQRLATVTHKLGASEEALGQAREALDLQRGLVAERPNDAERRYDLAATLHGLGVLYDALGRPDDAETAYEGGRALSGALADSHPDALRYRELQYRCTSNLGVLHLQQKRLDQAEDTDREALELARRQAEARPDLAEWQRFQGRGHNNLAVLYYTRGDVGRAGEHLKQALSLLEKAAALRPESADYQYELAGTAYNVASLDFRTAQALPPDRAAPRLAGDVPVFRRSIDALGRVARANPGVADYQHRLGQFWGELGLLYQVTGRLDEAAAAHQESQRLFERLTQDHPAVPGYAVSEAVSWQDLGNARRDAGDGPAALTCYDRAGGILEGLLRRSPQHVAARSQVVFIEANRTAALFQMGRYADAVAACDRAIQGDEGRAPHFLGFTRAFLQARLPGNNETAYFRANYAAAVREGEAVAATTPQPGGNLYPFACVLSLASTAARQDESLPSPRREALAEQYAARAVALFVKAHAAGYFRPAGRVEQLDQAPELAPLRGRDDFRVLRKELASREEIQRGEGERRGSSPPE